MEIVKTPNLETLNRNIKDDFYIVPNLKFDIDTEKDFQKLKKFIKLKKIKLNSKAEKIVNLYLNN